jgi:redox-sensitive bicupin YhaK (pirin superfamily)
MMNSSIAPHALEQAITHQDLVTLESPRRIIHRTGGSGEGPITRLVSPGDLGLLIKPFVFLDWFDIDPLQQESGFGYHPHSGIATVTALLSGAVHYADTTGKSGIMASGGVEWMRAGRAVWHTGSPAGSDRATGFQLWVALPPELETAEAESTYLDRADVPTDGPVRVILGSFGDAHSGIRTGSPMNYLHVRLSDGERWRYQPPASHDIAWLAVQDGQLETAGTTLNQEIAVFAHGDQAIEVVARGATSFVLGSARRHPYPLVMGPYSVHTNRAGLTASAHEIALIGHALRSHTPS